MMAEPLILINAFEVPGEDADQFVAAWEKTRDYLATQPGYLDTALRPDRGAIMTRTGRRDASRARTRRLPRAQNRTFCMRRSAHHTRLPPTQIRQGGCR